MIMSRRGPFTPLPSERPTAATSQPILKRESHGDSGAEEVNQRGQTPLNRDANARARDKSPPLPPPSSASAPPTSTSAGETVAARGEDAEL